ncbi:hypothetical protein STEG23_005040 [Scotinomys teguina]
MIHFVQAGRTWEVSPHCFRQHSSVDRDPPAHTAGVLVQALSQEDVVDPEAAAAGGRTGEAVMEKVIDLWCTTVDPLISQKVSSRDLGV